MSGPILIDLSHTSHTAARTGVQRVALGLRSALGAKAQAITYDPYARQWRGLQPWETRNLEKPAPAGQKRSAHWPWTSRMNGRLSRVAQAFSRRELSLAEALRPGASQPELAQARGLIVPEIFSARVGAALPALLAEVEGPSVAVFHDAIALRFPEWAAPKTVARFPGYLRELAQFDGIAAVSEASKAELLGYWEWAGIGEAPPVVAIPLGVSLPRETSPQRAERVVPNALGGRRTQRVGDNALHQILSVGTIEGRKNHLALLQACDVLWQRGLKFELRLIGLAQRQTGAAAIALIAQLQAAGRPIHYGGAASETELEQAYADATFTVYPSHAEGFGLPVAESLIRRKPCICSNRGALGEIAAGGGCLTVTEPTRDALATACARLIENPAELAAITEAAARRVFPTPGEHAGRLLAFVDSLRR